jgi:hypothetical protein
MHWQPWRSSGPESRSPLRAIIAPILLGLAAGLANCSAALPGTGNTPNPPPPAGGGAYAADTLYAYPLSAEAQVGKPVTVVVATGRPAHPFQFLAVCSVTIESQGAYAPGSFNYGAPGGERTDSDGVWGLMGIPNGAYLDLGDGLVPGAGEDTPGGRRAYEFAVVSQGPYPALNAEGALFNFQLTFSAPGAYHLGLRQTDGDFDMLYYSDANGKSYRWGALLADATGALNPDVPGYSNEIRIVP